MTPPRRGRVRRAPGPPGAGGAPASAPWPFAYDWSRFPAAWFGANATHWESPEQIAAIGKYAMAILGWQHLGLNDNMTAVVYPQLTQMAIIKDAHPSLPVFVYCSFGWASTGAEAIARLADVEIGDAATGRPTHPPRIATMRLVPAEPLVPGSTRSDRRIAEWWRPEAEPPTQERRPR